MQVKKYDDVVERIKERLKPDRFYHSLGVAYTACSLAMCYKCDYEKAFLAGLLHDCAKLKDADYLHLAEKYNVQIEDYALKNPPTLHSAIGACMVREDFGIDDEEIIMAVSSHNFGRPDMSLLEKILFVADYIEPNRNFDNDKLNFYRSLAFINLDKCVGLILKDTVDFVKSNGYVLVPIGYEAYLYYYDGEKDD